MRCGTAWRSNWRAITCWCCPIYSWRFIPRPGLLTTSNWQRAFGHGGDDHAGPRLLHLGHDRAAVYCLALKCTNAREEAVEIDIAPTLDIAAHQQHGFARAYYHWFHLIQPAPLPGTMIGGDARAYLHFKLGGWGSAGLACRAGAGEYERCFCTPEAIHAACEDYRASAGIDLGTATESRARGEDRVRHPGNLGHERRGARLFDPLALWRAPVRGR